MRVAAIDQGTTSTRLLIVEDGVAEIRRAVRHRQDHPRPGWVEHDPMELLANVRACAEAVGPAAALGLDNQGESCLAWDGATGEPLSPVIVWQDSRTSGGDRAHCARRAPRPSPWSAPACRSIPISPPPSSLVSPPRWAGARLAPARHDRCLVPGPADRTLRHRRHHGVADLADEPGHLHLGRGALPAVRGTARLPARDPPDRRRFRR